MNRTVPATDSAGNKADSAQWETFHVYREESRIRHKLQAGMR